MERKCRGSPGIGNPILRVFVIVFIVASLVAEPASSEDPPPFLLKWGGLGGGQGLFGSLFGVAVDVTGNVYVTDETHCRIQKFDGNGSYLSMWGTCGTGNGAFGLISDIVVDSTGNVYAADSGSDNTVGNYRIQKFDIDGAFVAAWGSKGVDYGQFEAGPDFLAADYSGNVYASDYGNHRVQKFDSTGTFLTQFVSMIDNEFLGPYGIGADSAGYIYVVDRANGRIVKYDGNDWGAFHSQWGRFDPSNPGNGTFCNPLGLAVDPWGNVYVSEGECPYRAGAGCWVQKFDTNGNFLTQWGGCGSGDGKFLVPIGIDVDHSGNVYVADRGTGMIQKFGHPPGATPTGDNVSTSPLDPIPVVPGTSVNVTFTGVTQEGDTIVSSSAGGTPPPAGFSLGDSPVYFNIETTAVFTPPITVCFNYTGISVADDSILRLYHQQGGVWEDVTISLDSTLNIICGETSSLSPFVILKPTYRFLGFFEPIQNGSVVNLANAGRTISLKWQLRDEQGGLISDLSAVTGTIYQEKNCTDGGTINSIDATALSSGNSGLRYDFSSNQYIYAWKTEKNMSGKCYRLNVELFGSDIRSADFELR